MVQVDARRTTPSPAVPALAAVVAAGLIATCAWFFLTTRRGQVLDELALRGSTIGAWRLDAHAATLLQTVSVPAVALAMVVVLVVGLARRRVGAAVVGAGVIAAANVTTQLLKYAVLTRPDLIPGDHAVNSLPSGHTTVAASAVVGLLIVIGRPLRPPLTVLGVAVVAAFGYATLVSQWHRPSDVVAAVLVACVWGYVGEAALRLRRREVTGPAPRSRVGVALVVLGGLALVASGLAALLAWGAGLGDAGRAVQFVAYAGGSAALAGFTAVGLGVLLLLRQRSDAPRVGLAG